MSTDQHQPPPAEQPLTVDPAGLVDRDVRALAAVDTAQRVIVDIAGALGLRHHLDPIDLPAAAALVQGLHDHLGNVYATLAKDQATSDPAEREGIRAARRIRDEVADEIARARAEQAREAGQ